MSFFKHVGTVNGKKAIIVQRQLSGDESHMAVVIYSEIMPSKYHDDVMKILESDEGQQSWEFRDILERRMMADGQNMLEALSSEGYLKRVPAANVMVTPNSKSSMRLDELTKLLNEVGKGPDAVARLERMENKQGLADPAKTAQTDAFVSDTVRPEELGINIAAENAKLNTTPSETISAATAPTQTAAPDMTAVMMEMMKTMQGMQKQLNELTGDKTPVAKAKAAPKTKAAPKSKTAARA
jgi:hypothetical protein